jgi:hypothetical protein
VAERNGTWIELDLSGEAIGGRLHDADNQPRPFSGWLEPVALVEAARARELGTASAAAVSEDIASRAGAKRVRSVGPSKLLNESSPSGPS